MSIFGDAWNAATDWTEDRFEQLHDWGADTISDLDDATSGEQRETQGRIRRTTDRLEGQATQPDRQTTAPAVTSRDVGAAQAGPIGRIAMAPAPGTAPAPAPAPAGPVVPGMRPRTVPGPAAPVGGVVPTVTAQTISARDVNAPAIDPTTIATGPQDQLRQDQMALNALLGQRVAGAAPSVAELQARQQLDRNVANQMGLASAMQGRSPGGALRQASTAIGALNADAAASGALLRAQEQREAEAMLGGLLGQQRAQDIGLAVEQGRLTSGETLAGADMGLRAGMANQATDVEVGSANQRADLTAGMANQDTATDIAKTNLFADLDLNKFNTGETNRVNTGNADRDVTAQAASGQLGLGTQRLDDDYNLREEELVLSGLGIEKGVSGGIDQARAGLISGGLDFVGDLLT